MNYQDKFLTVEQAAQMLKLSPQRIWVLLAKGRLQGYQHLTTGGRKAWRVHFTLKRSHGVAGRPRKKRRQACRYGGSEAKPC